MSGHRRPWLTSLLALVLGLGGFGLMFMADATDDYSGWPVVVAVAQLLWLWLVDLRGPDAQARMPLAARVAASFWLGVTGGVISAAALYAVLNMAVVAALPSDWDSMLALLALIALVLLTLAWGVRAWRVSKRHAPRAAVGAMLAPLTVFALGAAGLGYVSFRVSRDIGILGALLGWFALIAPLVVLAWTTLPWLELLLGDRAGARRAA